MGASKSLLRKSAITDLNERQLWKNLERRYRDLSIRYQEELDLLDREVSEFCSEFTHAVDDALGSVARNQFRKISPSPRLEHRLKKAADNATRKTLLAGGAGIVGSGAAAHAGLLSTAAVAGVAVTPVGMAVLGTIGLAGFWMVFSSPSDRQLRDVQQRAHALKGELEQITSSRLPEFERRVDEIVSRFQEAAEDDIAIPRVSALRLKETRDIRKLVAGDVAKHTLERIKRAQSLIERETATERGDQTQT